MYLYLIRHGIAEDPDPHGLDPIVSDESRVLTKLGRKKIIQVADRLNKLGVTFDLIITSPLIRARQTADIFIDEQIGTTLEVSSDLKPMGNFPAWLMAWDARSPQMEIATIALIGHEPNLSNWAELCVFGQVCHKLVLKKGGIIGLKFPDNKIAIGTAQLHCLIPPKYLGGIKS
jgi:phosphohistidine phosphatase